MNIETLKELVLSNEELRPHWEYIERLSRPSVVLDCLDAIPGEYESRFGGNPVVPAGFTWPIHEVGEYRFLGQINFAEIVNGPSVLPQCGILSLFYAFDEAGEVFWGDDGYVLGFYWPDLAELATLSSPHHSSTQSKKPQMTIGMDIPSRRDLRNDWPFSRDALAWLGEQGCFADDYLLGYPSFHSLAYDPTPGPGWISLLTLKSCEELKWRWHDGGKLMVFIELDKLKVKDFGSLKSDAG